MLMKKKEARHVEGNVAERKALAGNKRKQTPFEQHTDAGNHSMVSFSSLRTKGVSCWEKKVTNKAASFTVWVQVAYESGVPLCIDLRGEGHTSVSYLRRSSPDSHTSSEASHRRVHKNQNQAKGGSLPTRFLRRGSYCTAIRIPQAAKDT